MSDFGMELDVIDSTGNIERSLPSEQIHREGLLHRAVHILLISSDEKIYLRKRSRSLELYPGVWTSSVGEHVFHGETTDETARRALDDFLGLNLPLSEIGTLHVHDEIENEMMSVFITKGDVVPTLNPEHSEEGHFLTLPQLQEVVQSGQSTPHLKAALELYARSSPS